MILIQLSKKTDLAVYIHWSKYPSPKAGCYEQMFGDLPDDKLDELLKSKYRKEYFIEAKNFKYDVSKDQIVYYPTFDHLKADDRLEEESLLKWDGKMLSEMTTWKPDCDK